MEPPHKASRPYFSQFGEDKLLFQIFGGKREGLCVEVGANDGINDSNTFFFEGLGWNCVLVEPNPALCEQIRSTRKSIVHQVAASDREGEAVLLVAQGAERAHGVSAVNRVKSAADKIKSYGFAYTEIAVRLSTLDRILQDSGCSGTIDFLSIDVEGHELEVLRGFSLKKWLPTVLLIEDNSRLLDSSVRDYLRSHGYIAFKRTGVNDWYAHRHNRQLVNLKSTTHYKLLALATRIKLEIGRIPGSRPLYRFVAKHFRREE